ncbi:hypothetical protein KY360_05165 [Candidatus Woesearchaeota archaeon]|nr:hypothetical protein [Candidatus Woesearchaeota archaeon]
MTEEKRSEPRQMIAKDLEGKCGEWKTVSGKVEVEGKKVEIFYREKVIEIPRYRQQETSIKRIRRRELLPPFPAGFYFPAEKFRGLEVVAERFVNGKGIKEYKYAERDYPPAYSFDSKFDDVYRFLTDNIYPSPGTLVHVVNWRIGARIQGWDLADTKPDQENIQQFKKEGMYFQEIYPSAPGEKYFGSPGGKKNLYFAYGDQPYVKRYITPVFIFGQKNRNFTDYLRAAGASSDIFKSQKGSHTNFPLANGPDAPKLRWCHAEAALIPTKRGLNVLFFEAGNEDRPDAYLRTGEAK